MLLAARSVQNSLFVYDYSQLDTKALVYYSAYFMSEAILANTFLLGYFFV